jgi:hypothetical protein
MCLLDHNLIINQGAPVLIELIKGIPERMPMLQVIKWCLEKVFWETYQRAMNVSGTLGDGLAMEASEKGKTLKS